MNSPVSSDSQRERKRHPCYLFPFYVNAAKEKALFFRFFGNQTNNAHATVEEKEYHVAKDP